MSKIREPRHVRQTLRRFYPGPSYTNTGIWAPMPLGTGQAQDLQVEAEVNDLSRIVEEKGVISRKRLFDLLNAQTWGPFRFRTALHQAIGEGRVKRIRRGLYAKPSWEG